MDKSSLADHAVLKFSSAHPISYGKQVTIMQTPTKEKGTWVTFLLVSLSRVEKVRLLAADPSEGNFIVVRCSRSKGTAYAHRAVSVEWLEESSQTIENRITRLLGAMLGKSGELPRSEPAN